MDTNFVPLTPETTNLINADTIKLMKKSAILVNIARGGVVDESALCQALNEGVLTAAAVDTYSIEPLPQDHCFFTAPNIILTPHMGARTTETIAHIGLEAAKIVLEGLGMEIK